LAKNRKKKKKVSKSFFNKKKIAIVILAFFVSFLVVYSVNYFELFNKSHKEEASNDLESTKVLMDKMKKMLDEEKKRLEELPKISKKEQKKEILPPINEEKHNIENQFSEIKDYKKSLEKDLHVEKKEPLHVKKKYVYKGKPKLAIIIDDVSYANQTRLIKKIPYKVSPSFFPPSKRHPNTIFLAKDFKFAMVHLPMEASSSYTRPEESTLLVGDSTEVIRKRIKQIKKWFPNIKYYNNHTGSKFTSDLESMKKLFKVFKEENLVFVDSRTTAKTKAPIIAQNNHIDLISRDVFLDNSTDKRLIKEQLKKAVNVAKKRGYAVAIGHPHKNTLEVLIHAKSILKDVDLIYVKDL
jgi:polysaccharide deacetylase 2 family uncharacterized protein YibQ